MRLKLAVGEGSVDPLVEAGDAVASQVVLAEPVARRLAALTGGWALVGEQDGMRLFVAQRAKLELRIGSLALRPPAGEVSRLRGLLATELTASQTLHVVTDQQRTSKVGWPLRILYGTVVNETMWGGCETEHRFLVSYRFLEHSGEALLQVGDESLLQPHREDLLALLASGWPDWSTPSGVAVLSELWQ
jgi:hypothetical protein